MAVRVDWEKYLDLQITAGNLARACAEARCCGVSQLARSVHEEPPRDKNRYHSSYP